MHRQEKMDRQGEREYHSRRFPDFGRRTKKTKEIFFRGFLNERIYNGPIFPGVLLQGAGNFIGTLSVAFGL